MYLLLFQNLKKHLLIFRKQKSIDSSIITEIYQTELIKYLAGLDTSFVKTDNRLVALMVISDHEILNRVITISANFALASLSL